MELREAVIPVLTLCAEDVDVGRPIIDLIKDVPTRVDAYMRRMAKSYIKRVLGVICVLHPNADLTPVAIGPPAGCSDEQLIEAEEEMDQVATSFAERLEFV